MNSKENPHTAYMSLALYLAWRVKGTTLPNPAVGAVLVRNNKVVAWGSTQPLGGAHAEVCALNMARNLGVDLTQTTLYCTLEPCSHYGKNPPCTQAIIQAGIKRVFIGCKDQNPLVAGKGIETLADAGVEVKTGILKKSLLSFYEGFFYSIHHKKPFVTIKIAQTAQGAQAEAPGLRTALSSPDSLQAVRELRAQADGILIGGSTLRTDNPLLQAHIPQGLITQLQASRQLFDIDFSLPGAEVLKDLFLSAKEESILRNYWPRTVVFTRFPNRDLLIGPLNLQLLNEPHLSRLQIICSTKPEQENQDTPAKMVNDTEQITKENLSKSLEVSQVNPLPTIYLPPVDPGSKYPERDLLQNLISELGQLGYHSLWIEPGPTWAAHWLKSGLWQKFYIITTPGHYPEGPRWTEGLSKNWEERGDFDKLPSLGGDLWQVATSRR